MHKKKKPARNTKNLSDQTKLSKKSSPQKRPDKTNKEKSWLSFKVFLLLGIIFLITETLGIVVAKELSTQGLAEAPFTQNINDVENAIYLIAIILSTTLILIIALRIRKTIKFVWLLESIAIFTTCTIVLSALLPEIDLIVLLLTAIILIIRYTHKKSIWIRNLASIIAIAGAGSFLGISLGLLPITVFIIALAIYDIIAVFFTKHMVEIGKTSIEKNFAFTIAMHTKEHKFELGNGDLVIPLMVASSVMINGPFNNNGLVAGLCLAASFIGLMSSIYLVSKKKIAMPALPPQTLLMVIILGLALILGA